MRRAALVLLALPLLAACSESAVVDQIGGQGATRAVTVQTTDGREVACVITRGGQAITCDWGQR